MDTRSKVSYTAHGAQQQVAARADQAHGVREIGVDLLGDGEIVRELTADEARLAFERAFADFFERRTNEAVIRKAEAQGAARVIRHE